MQGRLFRMKFFSMKRGGPKKGELENVGERESDNLYSLNFLFLEQSSREGSFYSHPPFCRDEAIEREFQLLFCCHTASKKQII